MRPTRPRVLFLSTAALALAAVTFVALLVLNTPQPIALGYAEPLPYPAAPSPPAALSPDALGLSNYVSDRAVPLPDEPPVPDQRPSGTERRCKPRTALAGTALPPLTEDELRIYKDKRYCSYYDPAIMPEPVAKFTPPPTEHEVGAPTVGFELPTWTMPASAGTGG